MGVDAYAYNADHHCEKCMLDYARRVPFAEWVWPTNSDTAEYSEGGLWDLMLLVEDEIIRDSEGNAIHPVFSTDEWYNIGEGNQTLACSDCGAILDEYKEGKRYIICVTQVPAHKVEDEINER